MEPRAHHVLIGLFAVLGCVLIVAMALWSARYQSGEGWQEFQVRFEQPVSGLSVGSAVQYNGIHMGEVRQLSLDRDDPRVVVAMVRLRADTPVRQDTVARLSSSGLTGVSFIQLRGGDPNSPPLSSDATGELPVIQAEGSPLQRLIDASEDIANTASEVLLRALELLSEDNIENVSRTLEQANLLVGRVSAEADSVAALIDNTRLASEQLKSLIGNADQVVADVQGGVSALESHLVDRLPQLGEDLSHALARFASLSEVLERVITENESALLDFGSNSLARFGPALQEFRLLLRELATLSRRFEENPAQFLLGTDQPEEYQP